MRKKYTFILLLIFTLENITAQEENKTEVVSEVVFEKVDQMPYFESCKEEENIKKCTDAILMQSVFKQVKYPQICIDANIQGKVWVYYEVNKEGKLQNVRIEKSVHRLLDEEALRVVNSFPDYVSGVHQGKDVVVSFKIPINFILN